MRYYLARFRGYQIVVLSDRVNKVLLRLIEYTRVTKGNIGYSEDDIRSQAKIDPIDFVDDIGELSKMQDIDNRILQLKREYNRKLDNELHEYQKIKSRLRDLINAVNDDDDDAWGDL